MLLSGPSKVPRKLPSSYDQSDSRQPAGSVTENGTTGSIARPDTGAVGTEVGPGTCGEPGTTGTV